MKKIFSVVMLVLILFSSPQFAFAHPSAGDHWKEMRLILFGDEAFNIGKTKEIKDRINILQYASQICIDQFGKDTDKASFAALVNMGVKQLPSFEDIVLYPMTTDHRSYSHLGWDYDYSKYNDSRNEEWSTKTWPARRNLLISSVEKVFNFNTIPDFGDAILGTYTEQGNAFAKFLYCIHILGDHIEYSASTYKTGHTQVIPLGATRGSSLISDIISTFPYIFPTQNYSALERELNAINSQVCSVLNRSNFWENSFDEYHALSEKIRDVLSKEVPQLLKQEEYFKKVFYLTQ